MFAQESVMDIEKLKAEFEKLKYIEEKLEYLNFDEHLGCYVEKNNGMPVGLAAWVNGALYGFEQAAKAQAVPEGFVLVNAESLALHAQSIRMFNNGDEEDDYYEIENHVCAIEAMIEAQEQSHD